MQKESDMQTLVHYFKFPKVQLEISCGVSRKKSVMIIIIKVLVVHRSLPNGEKQLILWKLKKNPQFSTPKLTIESANDWYGNFEES